MKRAFLLSILALAFATPAAGINPPVVEDGGGGTNSYCGPSTHGKTIWTVGPFDGGGFYVCESITYTLKITNVGRCDGCTNDAYWLSGFSGGYWANVDAWVKRS